MIHNGMDTPAFGTRFMTTPAPLRYAVALLGIALGTASVVGAIILNLGSQDAMRVVIHWLGEERALGPQNVIVQPNGSKLLTNPSCDGEVGDVDLDSRALSDRSRAPPTLDEQHGI